MTEMSKPRVGISTCLLGENVRYDGQHKRDRYLTNTLGPFVEWVPICPEVECGLPIPREAMHLTSKDDGLHLIATRSGTDHTKRMQAFIAERIPKLADAGLCGFVFKKKSPSSGLHDAKYYTEKGMPHDSGAGLFAGAFVEAYPLIPVEDEGRLHDAGLRENFIERLFVMHRWRSQVAPAAAGAAELVAFHTAHKLTLMAHRPAAVRELGDLVAHQAEHDFDALRQQYLEMLMPALQQKTTRGSNVNVLEHVMGYFKKDLSADEKAELLEVIEQYHSGLIPLIVPVTLLRHYVRKYDQDYLRQQVFLHPFPAELMLRNHV